MECRRKRHAERLGLWLRLADTRRPLCRLRWRGNRLRLRHVPRDASRRRDDYLRDDADTGARAVSRQRGEVSPLAPAIRLSAPQTLASANGGCGLRSRSARRVANGFRSPLSGSSPQSQGFPQISRNAQSPRKSSGTWAFWRSDRRFVARGRERPRDCAHAGVAGG